ncbi:MAG: hypothetical protein ACREPR_15145 [Brasilonema sp.]
MTVHPLADGFIIYYLLRFLSEFTDLFTTEHPNFVKVVRTRVRVR